MNTLLLYKQTECLKPALHFFIFVPFAYKIDKDDFGSPFKFLISFSFIYS